MNNNAAAKRSRDRKKIKDEEVAFKAAFLEQGANSTAFKYLGSNLAPFTKHFSFILTV